MAAKVKIERSADEQIVWRMFTDQGYAGYQAIGCCQSPTCEDPYVAVVTAGVNPSARICVICFEFEFDCKHPTRAKLDAMRRRA